MTTTDPKLIERASLIAEQAYSAGNLVTCDGYYEFDLDAAAAVVAAAINEAAHLWWDIATWEDRCELLHGDNDVVTYQMIQNRMQEEIDDLRAAIEAHKESQP